MSIKDFGAMDTLRDKKQLEDLWEKGNPPWKLKVKQCLIIYLKIKKF